MDERYLIGNRFVLKKTYEGRGYLDLDFYSRYICFQFIDLQGEVYDILGKFGCNPLEKFGYKSLAEVKYKTLEELLDTSATIKGVYSDGRNLYWVLNMRIDDFHSCVVAVQGNKIVSYGLLTEEKPFQTKEVYINHYGKEIKVKVVRGEEVYFKRRGEEIEMGIDERGVYLDYIPFNRKLTPVIEGVVYNKSVVFLPEFGKIYNGERVGLEVVGKGLLVTEIKRNHRVRVYMLMPEGEYLIYRYKSTKYGGESAIPVFEKLGNVIIVKFHKATEECLKQGLFSPPNFNYLFVTYASEKDEDGKYRTYAYISFDMETWTRVKASKLVYRKSWEKVQEPLQYAEKVSLDEVVGRYKEYWKAYKEREVHQISI